MFLLPVFGSATETRGVANPPPWGLPASPGKGQRRAPPGSVWAMALAFARAAASALATGSVSAVANRNMVLSMNARRAWRDWFSGWRLSRALEGGLWPPAYVRT